MTRTLYLVFGTASLALGTAAPAHAFCPCYTKSSAYNDHDCGVEAVTGQNPSPDEWNEIFALVSKGAAAWGDQGPSVPDIGQGCGKPEPLHSVPARFPCELLKGIAMQETGWRQFCAPDTPADQDGKSSRTIISFDCGYGIGQVTSGMHAGESPDFDRARVAAEPIYNMATGTRILAEKWKATNCVGDNQPTTIEHWYVAAWAYNGLAYVNNPNNPNYDGFRGVWDPQNGGAAPYQEKVFGWVEHPANGWYEAVALAYPPRGELGNGGVPPDVGEPSCASPTDCGNQRPTHTTACTDDPPDPGTTTDLPGTTTDDPPLTTTSPDPVTSSDPTLPETTAQSTTNPDPTLTTAPDPSNPDPDTTNPTNPDQATTSDPSTPTSSAEPTTTPSAPNTLGGLPPDYGMDDDTTACGCRHTPVPEDILLLALTPLLVRRRRATPTAPRPLERPRWSRPRRAP